MNSPAAAATAVLDDALTGEWTRGEAVDPVSLKKTAGAFPSGVTVVTTTSGGKPVGMTISAFASVSLDPPLLLVCVARTAGSIPAFRVGVPMGVNVLANDQAWLARRFAGRHEDRFAGVPLQPGPDDVPLLEGVAAWLNCRIARIYDGGDHVILLGRVHTVHRSGAQPLLYHSGKMHDWATAVTEATM